jgi:serine/threonine protein kinase/Tol biopolymer transport system component
MGEVYRARDTKLGRDVALKLLPELFASDPERLARFQREAQVLASLNHPHIAQIYGLEDSTATPALVMELVVGVTVAHLINSAAPAPSGSEARQAVGVGPQGKSRKDGGLPIADALNIAGQVAEALETAHDRGIIHRDLKPANVMVTGNGAVKVLDFGLAAIAQPGERDGADPSHSPTMTLNATRAGLILGTAAYMSPEQAAGKPVDRRADIWSFGVLLWELLTGRQLFDGETVSHTLADVLRAEIDLSKLPPDTPPRIRELVRRCLDRDVSTRLRDIGEARVAIQRYLADPEDAVVSPATSSAKPPSRAHIAAWALAGAAVVAASALAFVHFRERPVPSPTVRFQIQPREQSTFVNVAVVSPDGRRLVFDAPGPDGRPMLWMRALDGLDAQPLPGTEGVAAGPFWSPDGRSLGFGVNGFPGRLKRIDVSGGPPQPICEYSGGFREGAWGPDGTIVFGTQSTGLARVPAAGGAPAPLTTLDAARQEVQHAGPAYLPDGRRFLYFRGSRAAEHRGIYIGSLDLPPERQSLERLLVATSDPVYVPSSAGEGGRILFLRDASLFVQAFDGRTAVTGDATRVAESIGARGSYGWFSASATGALTYRESAPGARTELVWFDRQGKRLGQIGPGTAASGIVSGIDLSPDGRTVIMSRGPEQMQSLAIGGAGSSRAWIAEVSRGIFSRLNAADHAESSLVMSPDGRVAFSSTIDGAVGDLYWMPSTGVGSPEPLLLKSPTVKHPNGFSPDGKYLIFDDHHPTRYQDLWILPTAAPASGERKPIPFLVTPADETFGQVSPDGKWIAYSSDESGRREVYVQGFAPDQTPAAAVGKWPISTEGGDKPRWRHDGKELYYIAPDRKLMAVPLTPGPTFTPGVAVPLFEVRVIGFFPYDVAPDGRFLLNVISDAAVAASVPVTIVLNWQTGLGR